MAIKPQTTSYGPEIKNQTLQIISLWNISLLLFIFIFSSALLGPSHIYAEDSPENNAKEDVLHEESADPVPDVSAAGSLFVTSEPSSASIYIDNRIIGTTPLSINDIPAGKHTLTVTKEGYADSGRDITINAGGITEVYSKLDMTSLIVKISSVPEGAEILWDETNKGLTPVIIENVNAGTHKIKLSKEGFDVYVDVIKANTPLTEKSFQLRPHTGGITVKTKPPGAEVIIDNKPAGTTPLSIGALSVKGHSVTLEKKGYMKKEINVVISRDSIIEIQETLQQIDTQKPEIIFKPASKIIKENKNIIKAKIIENQTIGEVLLMLKMANEINFQALKMTDKMNGFYEALVPGTFLRENALLEYYISACDTQNNCESSGSSETPHHMKVISLKPRTEGFVLEVQKKKTVISIGSMDRVFKGDKYIVFRTGKEFRDPETNELLQIEEILVGTLQIKELMPKTAYASIDDSFVPLEKNDRIRKQVSSPREFITENSHASKIILRWSPNPEPEVKGYYLYRAEKIDGDYRKIAQISDRDSTYYEDTYNMKEGLTFYYRITAVNMLKTEGITSVPIIGRTKGKIPPPSDFRADGMRVRKVSLTWTAYQNDPDLEQYVIFRSETGDGNFSEIAKVKKNTNNYSDRGKLQDGKVYYYKIASYSRNGSIGEQSAAVMGKTKEPPSPPENIRAESSAVRNIKLQWSRHSDSDVAGHIIYRSEHENGNFMETGKSKNTGYLDKDLPDGKMYYYKVASYFSAGRDKIKGQPSVPVSATTKYRPKPPADVVAENGLPKKATIKWNINEEKDISEYWIYRGTDSKLDRSPYAKLKPNVSTFTDNDLKNNTAYSYAVRAVDADGLESDLSNTVRAVTKPLPSRPAGLKGKVKGGKLLLDWTPNPEQDIKAYNVYRKKWLGSSILLSPDTNSCEITPEENEESIKLYITAIDKDDLESEPSEVIEVILK